MLIVALSKDQLIYHLDVNNVFLNGVLYEEVFMEQPPRFIQSNQSQLVCKVNKALYGLNQAQRAWFENLGVGSESIQDVKLYGLIVGLCNMYQLLGLKLTILLIEFVNIHFIGKKSKELSDT